MTKADNKKLRKRKTKPDPKPDIDEEGIDTELESMYKIEMFYKFGPMYARIVLALIGICLFLCWFIPAMRYITSVGIVFWTALICLIKYFGRYKGTKHEEYGMKAFYAAVMLLTILGESCIVRNDSLASEMGRKAHVSLVIFPIYFIQMISARVVIFPRYKRLPFVSCGIAPLLAWKYPRFGILEPRYEALAFFVTLGSGWICGCIIDEILWRHFVVVHKKDLELKETRKRAMAYEALACREETFFEVR